MHHRGRVPAGRIDIIRSSALRVLGSINGFVIVKGDPMKTFFVLVFMSCGFLIFQSPVYSQENSDSSLTVPAASTDAAASEDEDKFAFGSVVSFSNGNITIKELDVSNSNDVEAVYTVNAETEFGDVDTAAHLKAGDNVVLDYIEKDGKRIITTLVKQDSQEMGAVSGDDTISVNTESYKS